MYCPQCGQQQVSEVIRFCSRCGFPLEGVTQLLASGGALAAYLPAEGPKQMSPKRKGVKQGALLLLIGALLVPIMWVFSAFTVGIFSEGFQMLAALFALLCFVGGPLRMLYAALFEEGAPSRPMLQPRSSYIAPALPQAAQSRMNVLPPAAANPMSAWRRPNTAELVNPPSVTEHTTRLLDQKNDRESNQ
jgi:hypothetical protein